MESRLLAAQRGCRWARRRPLEGAVHALVPTVPLRMRGLDRLRINPEPDPPRTELREPPERARRKGHAIVGPQNLRQAVLLEEPFEYGPTLRRGRAGEPATSEQVTAEAVLHRQRKAVAPVAQAELPFVVRRPDHIRRRHRRERPAGVAAPRAPAPRGRETVAAQELRHRAPGGPAQLRPATPLLAP